MTEKPTGHADLVSLLEQAIRDGKLRASHLETARKLASLRSMTRRDKISASRLLEKSGLIT